MRRRLVCSSVEQLWPNKDVPVVFLGEWCLLESRKDEWQQYDYTVVPHHWDVPEKMDTDIEHSHVLYEQMLVFLVRYLNSYHKLEKSEGYWRIVLGPWLIYMVQIVMDRWGVISTLLEQDPVSGFSTFDFDEQVMTPLSMDMLVKDFIGQKSEFVSDHWHEYIFSQVLSWKGIDGEILDESHEPFPSRQENSTVGIFFKFKVLVREAIEVLLRHFTKANEVFFLSTYLSVKSEIALQLRMWQVPKFYRRVPVPVYFADIEQRHVDAESYVSDRSLVGFLKFILVKQIPIAYKEGFSSCLNQIELQNWPRKPKLIFTANSYASDDLFKIWMATKEEEGTPICIGQHGGSYGIAQEAWLERHLFAISDAFVSWGWQSKDNKNVVPLGILKSFGRGGKYDKQGKITLIHMAQTRLPYHIWTGINGMSQWKDYAQNQYMFVRALSDNARGEIRVRLLASDLGVEQQIRWPTDTGDIEFDDGSAPFLSVMEKSRLIISTYNATTFLESMSLNVPTIIFWDPNHYRINENASPYFELLKSVGIFHDSAESAAAMVSLICDNVDEWWLSSEVQDAKEKFCDQFCKMPRQPLTRLINVLNSVAL
jgi:putative transferase (TIGR04331 family)